MEVPDRVPSYLESEFATPEGLRGELSPARKPLARALKTACVAGDLAAISTGLLLAFVATRWRLVPESRRADPGSLLVGLWSLPLWIAAFSHFRLYKSRFISSRPNELSRLLHAVVTGILGVAAISFLSKVSVARSWILLSFFTVFVCCLVERQVVRGLFDRLRRQGGACREVLLVGTNAEARRIFDQLTRDPRLGYHIVGTIGDGPGEITGVPYFGSVDDVLSIAAAHGVTGVIVATTAVPSLATNWLARQLTDAGLHVELSSSLADVGAERLTVRPLGYFPMLYIEPVRRNGWQVAAKRAFDVTGAALGLLALAPILAAAAVWIKITSEGPVLFRQTRVGRDEQAFKVLKLRTMVVDAEAMLVELRGRNEADGPLFKLRDDPRVTRVGRTLRKHSLDELPQLINVLKGEMSLVGPRPALFDEMAQWSDDLRAAKLSVRPGLTGIWQVSGRSNLTFSEYVRLDLFYVQNWSLWRDLAIVARTIPVVLKRDGAY